MSDAHPTVSSPALLLPPQRGEPMELVFTVNGEERRLRVPSDRRLLDILRDDLGLTSVKEGCGIGECGACTVLLDGKAVQSCLLRAFQLPGRRVTTVEGLGTPEAPSPVQTAFVAAGAVQCGFCTPGMVVAVTALLEQKPDVSREEARELLSGNVCRCTGYAPILDAVEMARDGRVPPPPPSDGVGVPARRLDALEKVTGRARYTADLPLPPGTLHGVTVRAPWVHARLLGIEKDEALAVPGVVRVLDWRDVPGELHYGNAVDDQPVFAKDRVRFWGEAVALVLAESLEAAREGAARVRLLAEELPPVLDPEQALSPEAPRLHPGGNLLVHQKLRKGDAERALAEAPLVFERSYRSQAQEHLYLEPEAALAEPWLEDGRAVGVTVRAPSQNVFFDRLHICRTLGLKRKQVRVVQQTTGAAFGGREDLYAQIHAALGALLTGRPVRVLWSREETQVASTKRHPARMRYRAGVARDGRLLALQVDVLADTGAYASWAPNIARKMLVHAAGPYEIPNVSVDVRMVYTNNGISGAFRGFGAPQVAFASESFYDELARELGMDPLEFRRRNHLRLGSRTATGQVVHGSFGLPDCVERAVAEAERRLAALPPPPPHVARGKGISTIFYGIGYGNAIPDIGSASLELVKGGIFELRTGAIDYGQGALTAFTQIACEVLGITRARSRILTGDSARTPDSGSTVASRQTYVSGEAVRQAAERLRDGLFDFAAEHWGVPRDSLRMDDEGIWSGESRLASLEELRELALDAGVRLKRQARFRATTTRLDPETGQGDAYWPYAFAAHVAVVEVDRRTGQLRVPLLVAAHDVGRAINPDSVRGQITGGVAQGLGFALFEEHRLEDGVPLTLNLDTYRVPGAADVPEVVPIIVEAPEPTGPFGAKGVGEPTLVAVAPAVANAVADAVGVRIRELPILPERVWAALHPEEEPA